MIVFKSNDKTLKCLHIELNGRLQTLGGKCLGTGNRNRRNILF